jgi:hypothetical protein
MVIFSIAKLSERTGLTAIVHVSPMPFFSLSTKLHSPSMLCVCVRARARVRVCYCLMLSKVHILY